MTGTKPNLPDQEDDVDRFIAQRAKESPEVDTAGMAIFGRINRIATRMAPHMEALFARYGLERGEFDVLATLQRSGPPYRLSPTVLYTSLMVSSGGLTHRLKRLEAAGLIRRIPSAEDRRSLIVELTDEGKKVTTAAFAEDMQLESSWLTALTPEERHVLTGLLRKLGFAVPIHGDSSDPPA
ncbi:MarR family winged helix-turn-helix transcriptional regulator [Rhodobacter sp. SY28-1]|uniref:MarR family winged helix-turn-helix transcriptional regulator n=1 Tax=Rhodobacter sp. SY28-1 TaxID=2562317 RepID=UPI0014855D28|nr:MarR family transcriptional regulator [Rhodobacter sp. SY28-1]